MTSFDSAMDDLYATVDLAAQKTCAAVESTKWFMERLRLRKEMNEKYRQLGKAQFLTATGASDETDAMDVLVAELTELQQAYVDVCKLLQRGEGSICPRCGKQNVPGNVFCADCGAAMGKDAE